MAPLTSNEMALDRYSLISGIYLALAIAIAFLIPHQVLGFLIARLVGVIVVAVVLYQRDWFMELFWPRYPASWSYWFLLFSLTLFLVLHFGGTYYSEARSHLWHASS